MSPAPAPPPASVGPPPPRPAVFLAWPRPAQLALALLLGLAILLLAFHSYSYSRWGSQPTQLEPGAVLAYRTDLNEASHAEFLQLPGVGESLADRLEDYRDEHGRFHRVEDLAEVRGVGPSTLKRLRSWVVVSSEKFAEDAHPSMDSGKPPRSSGAAPGPAKKAGKKGDSLAGPIDINRATLAQLQQLPDIGPRRAQAIVAERTKRPFLAVDELRRVPGIGAKRLETLRPFVTVGSEQVRMVDQ
ncbi:MAG: helix-hairpin-helix domain-containing protein [Planctomycetes bacterium]|nr:helix-hairpin-helix domain-containing protein [Planctomycetota bacterium]